MKLAKVTICTFFLLILFNLQAFCQMPEDGNYQNWNWEDQSINNWKRNKITWDRIAPPFLASTDKLNLMSKVYYAGDYKKENGWCLLWANFSQSYPYFILYNKHRAIIRVFVYLEDLPFTHLLVTMAYDDPIGNPGLLALGNEYIDATDKYLSQTHSKSDRISVIIPDVGPNRWGAADFNVLFDNNIEASLFSGKKWVVEIFGCEDYQILIKGTAITQAPEGSIIGQKSDLNRGINQLSADNAKLHKELVSTGKLKDDLNNSVKNIDDKSPQFLQDYKSIVTDIASLASVFTTASGASAAASVVLGFLKIITGAVFEDETKATLPALINLDINLQGSLKIKYPLAGTTLYIPGVQNGNDPNLNWSPFRCPVGVFNLQKTPKIKVTSLYDRFPCRPWSFSAYVPVVKCKLVRDCPTCPPRTECNTEDVLKYFTYSSISHSSGFKGKYRKYKIEEDIELAINTVPGMELVDVNFALVCKPIGKTIDFTYKIDAPAIGIFNVKYVSTDHYNYTKTLGTENPVYRDLVSGKFIVHKFDSDNNDVWYGSPLLKMNQLKGIVAEVPDSTDVKLRVVAKFKSNTYNQPIIFSALYNFDNIEVAPAESVIWCTDEQPTFPNSDYYIHTNFNPIILSNNPNTSQYVGQTIILSTNFVGGPGFSASAVSSYPQNGNTLINYKSYPCYSMPSMSPSIVTQQQNTEGTELIKDHLEKDDLIIYPNPTSDILNISNINTIDRVYLVDIMGKRVISLEDINSSNVQIDISNLPDAFYIVNVFSNNKSITKKIIKRGAL